MRFYFHTKLYSYKIVISWEDGCAFMRFPYYRGH